jgi:hypothetical protein
MSENWGRCKSSTTEHSDYNLLLINLILNYNTYAYSRLAELSPRNAVKAPSYAYTKIRILKVCLGVVVARQPRLDRSPSLRCSSWLLKIFRCQTCALWSLVTCALWSLIICPLWCPVICARSLRCMVFIVLAVWTTATSRRPTAWSRARIVLSWTSRRSWWRRRFTWRIRPRIIRGTLTSAPALTCSAAAITCTPTRIFTRASGVRVTCTCRLRTWRWSWPQAFQLCRFMGRNWWWVNGNTASCRSRNTGSCDRRRTSCWAMCILGPFAHARIRGVIAIFATLSRDLIPSWRLPSALMDGLSSSLCYASLLHISKGRNQLCFPSTKLHHHDVYIVNLLWNYHSN